MYLFDDNGAPDTLHTSCVYDELVFRTIFAVCGGLNFHPPPLYWRIIKFDPRFQCSKRV